MGLRGSKPDRTVGLEGTLLQPPLPDPVLPSTAPPSYAALRALGNPPQAPGSDGIVYGNVRHAGGSCIGLFYTDCASDLIQTSQLDYH